MLRKTVAAVVMAAVAGFAGAEYASAPASAAMPYVPAPLVTGDVNIQPVATWVYVKGKHGNRYAYKRPGYGYKYGGYWYAKRGGRQAPFGSMRPTSTAIVTNMRARDMGTDMADGTTSVRGGSTKRA